MHRLAKELRDLAKKPEEGIRVGGRLLLLLRVLHPCIFLHRNLFFLQAVNRSMPSLGHRSCSVCHRAPVSRYEVSEFVTRLP